MLKIFTKSLLNNFLGWKELNNKIDDIASKFNRVIFIYPHTHIYDHVSVLLYAISDSNLEKHSHKIVLAVKKSGRNDAFMCSFIRNYSSIKKIDIKDPDGNGNGNVQHLISQLENIPEWFFLITPKTQLEGNKWRTGWYHIAKHFNVPICVIGPDFNTQEIKISKELIFVNEKNYDQVEKEAKLQYKEIVPFLKKRDKSVEYRPHDYVSIISKNNYYSIIFILLLIISCLIFAIYAKKRKIETGIPNLSNRYKLNNT